MTSSDTSLYVAPPQGSADHTVASSNAEAIAGQWRGVHKLAKAPTHSEVIDGHTRRIWCVAKGRPLIEAYTIAGMGHGTPLMTRGDDGLGVPWPFMLDVGISSTRRIAQFWGIAESSKGASAKQQRPEGTQSPSRSHASVPAMTETTRKTLQDTAPTLAGVGFKWRQEDHRGCASERRIDALGRHCRLSAIAFITGWSWLDADLPRSGIGYSRGIPTHRFRHSLPRLASILANPYAEGRSIARRERPST